MSKLIKIVLSKIGPEGYHLQLIWLKSFRYRLLSDVKADGKFAILRDINNHTLSHEPNESIRLLLPPQHNLRRNRACQEAELILSMVIFSQLTSIRFSA